MKKNNPLTVPNPYASLSSRILKDANLTSITCPLILNNNVNCINDSSQPEMTLNSENKYISNQKCYEDINITETLPSRFVSFNSSEIVTVSEVVNEYHNIGDSLRITGIIYDIDFESRYMILGDPLSKILKDPPYNSNKKNMKHYIQKNTKKKSSQLLLNSDKKRKLITVKYGRGITGFGLSHSKSLSPISRKCVSENLIRDKVRKGLPIVVVDVSSVPSMRGCSIDDLITVLGEVSSCSTESLYMPKDLMRIINILVTEPVRKIPDDKRNKDNSSKNDEINLKMESQLALKEYNGYYIRARVLRNSNGTDMNLFQEALMLRRRHLKDRIKIRINDVNNTDPYLGTGPH